MKSPVIWRPEPYAGFAATQDFITGEILAAREKFMSLASKTLKKF
jgi:hypothetical protein